MNISQSVDWGKIWNEQRIRFKTTIFDNEFIPQRPFFNQTKFLIYPSEKAFYGGVRRVVGRVLPF